MRNLFRVLVASVFLSCLAPGCALAPPVGHEVVVDDATCRVDMVFIGKDYEIGVILRFVLYGTDYTHIVQEITLDSGEVLVECFRDDGWCYDRHTWGTRPHSRSMTVYAANCVGVDECGGFGHLPHNGQGLSSTVSTDFNEDYQRDYETQGYIRERASNEYEWSISDNGTKISVTINGVAY